MSVVAEFWARVDRRGPDDCWPWLGTINRYGYGQWRNKARSPHRFVHELVVGPIPAGLVMDHLCHNRDLACIGGPDCRHRRCVNPAHLEPVTRRENMHRAPYVARPQCKHGHARNAVNTRTWVSPEGFLRQLCRPCEAHRTAAYHARSMAAA